MSNEREGVVVNDESPVEMKYRDHLHMWARLGLPPLTITLKAPIPPANPVLYRNY